MKKVKLTFGLLALFILSLAPKSWADCSTPTRLETMGITTSSAVLSWEAGPDAYRYAIKVVNGPGTPAFGISIITDEPRVEVRGLMPGEEYLFIVKAWCLESMQDSDYSQWAAFRTLENAPPQTNCEPPADLKAVDVTPFSTTLVWARVENAEKYELEFQKEEQPYFTLILRENTFSLNRLYPMTKYRFRVRSICSGGQDVSEYSGWYDFLTPARSALRVQSDVNKTASAYPNPADQLLNLKVSNIPDGQQATLKAFNAQGQLLLETDFDAYKDQAQPVDVAGLPNGMYFLVVESNGQRLMEQRVMVAHQ